MANNEDNSFLISLHESLVKYGYLIDSSEDGIKNFESLYGKTEIETPKEIWETINSKLSKNFDQNDITGMAAFTSDDEE